MTEEDKEKAKALLKVAGLDSEISAILLRCLTLECVKSEIANILEIIKKEKLTKELSAQININSDPGTR